MTDDEREQTLAQVRELLAFPEVIADDFSEMVVDTVLGGVWDRPGLSRRDRSLITIAALTALDRHNELEIHLGLGRANGLSQEEICEVIMHMAIYGGFPVAVEGMRVAKKVFESEG